MPDITPAQIVALVGAVIALAVAYGAPVSESQAESIVSVVQILAPILLGADAVIRAGRAIGKPPRAVKPPADATDPDASA